MRPVGLPEIPELTAVVARAAFPKGSLAIRVRDRLAEVFADGPFTGAFGVRGAPGLSPGLLSLVTVLQFAENLTDRQAAAMAVRAIDWKYALGAELTDTGFDASVLAKFRSRLVEHGMERVVFDRLVEHCREMGLVRSGGKQRTDSTHVISAVRDLNRTELAGESVRAALEALAVAAPSWLASVMDVVEAAERYGPRVDGWTMPSSKTRRDRLAEVFGQDALVLCRAAWSDDAPVWIREIEAVALLRQVLVQTYTVRTDARGREVVKKRDADDEGVPPGHLRLASPYDSDARWSAKGDDVFWCGYKVHLTESCDTLPEAEAGVLRLVTDVHTTVSTVPDVMATEPIQQNVAARQLAPAEHYLDSGYPSADLVTEAAGRGITMITPLLADHSPQAKAAEGFDKIAFTIDWRSRQVRCPEGATSAGWYPVTQHGKDAIVVDFARADCRPCPSRTQCTASARGTRMLTLRPRELHERTVAARAEQKTKSWKAKYALRSGIEGTINQALDITGIRRARYRGLPKTTLQHAFSATAINIIRLDTWWTTDPLRKPRTSRLQHLSYRLIA
ncbi:IS1182 family transposase [Streptomyces sp. NBC_01217]|uniref:IS1182 family transposase n=1 Tax=Streptomyces sp. NBC_01217 TaxID=2903779 RepID=UPI002E15B64E|nr:IS1182 family transposase [Streptomyces sp. NBC_01217]